MPPSPLTGSPDLPVLGSEPVERADAARNRRRILVAAERLLGEREPDCVSMDAIAAAADVGKGTLFRRFGDRASLLRALLDDRERAFQDAFIRGPAPLGPGVPPAERLVAFGHALLAHLEAHGPLIVAAETGGPSGRRFRTQVYAAYRAHIVTLLREGAPDLDADHVADVLLGALSADLVLHQRRERGMSLAALEEGWTRLIGRLADPWR